ncbi:MAG: TM2 domain-containing protein [Eubacteriales bacterium]
MYCRNCGREMGENQNKCESCGTYQNIGTSTRELSKSRLVVGIIGILLGTLGIHNFILGHTSRGLTQLLITCLTCGVGGFIVWVWSLVESIQILTGQINEDAHGNPLTD